jgi:S-adenosylmethionine hydrolase
MKQDNNIVTLLTDFGTEDGYVAAMKGVLLRSKPNITIVDVSHNIHPYDIRQAAYTLINYAYEFPSKTIHLVVVDPGVGSERNGLILKTDKHYFIGPDNGVFSYVIKEKPYEAFKIKQEDFGPNVSPTFHGRDIFAPAAVRIINKEKFDSFTDVAGPLHTIFENYMHLTDNVIKLKVLHIDHFGNLILNFSKSDWRRLKQPKNIKIEIGRQFIHGIKNTFADVHVGEVLMNWDSQGFLQIAQRHGNAAQTLGLQINSEVLLKFK